MILVADAHVSRERGNVTPFFDMLSRLSRSREEIIFLGDIFDLWIALPRYEGDIHRHFLDWCRAARNGRCVGFIEGNHEFFVARNRSDAFSWCTESSWHQEHDGRLFCHGDRINRQDRWYLRFRRISRHPVTQAALRAVPAGPRLADSIRRGMKYGNQAMKKWFPDEEISRFAAARFTEGASSLHIGHFHRDFIGGTGGRRLRLVPAWFREGQIMVTDPATGEAHCRHWTEI